MDDGKGPGQRPLHTPTHPPPKVCQGIACTKISEISRTFSTRLEILEILDILERQTMHMTYTKHRVSKIPERHYILETLDMPEILDMDDDGGWRTEDGGWMLEDGG